MRSTITICMLAISILLMPVYSAGQVGFYCGYNPVDSNDAVFKTDLCQFFGAASDKVAGGVVDAILEKIGITNSIKIVPCAKIKNCYTWYYNHPENPGQYILYDPAFLEKITRESASDWGAKCVLAHEVAHVLYSHTIHKTSNRQFELRADEWSGYAMYKLGAPEAELMRGVDIYADEHGDDVHAPRHERKQAVLAGYNRARRQYETKMLKADLSAARADYEKAMSATSNAERIHLLTKAINVNEEFEDAYYHRAKVYLEEKQYDLALADISKAISLDPDDADNNYLKSDIYLKQELYKEAKPFIDKALVARPDDLKFLKLGGRIAYYASEYQEAITKYDKILQAEKTYEFGYYYRSYCYYELKNYHKALEDVNAAMDLKADKYNYKLRGKTYYKLKAYQLALADLNKAKELWPEDAVNIQLWIDAAISENNSGKFPPSAKINKVWLEHNIYIGDKYGMKVHVNFETDNMIGVKGKVICYFYYSDGTRLKGVPGFITDLGSLCVSEDFTPKITGDYNDLVLFIPYNAFNVPKGKVSLKCRTVIWDFIKNDGNMLFQSEFAPFSLTYE